MGRRDCAVGASAGRRARTRATLHAAHADRPIDLLDRLDDMHARERQAERRADPLDRRRRIDDEARGEAAARRAPRPNRPARTRSRGSGRATASCENGWPWPNGVPSTRAQTPRREGTMSIARPSGASTRQISSSTSPGCSAVSSPCATSARSMQASGSGSMSPITSAEDERAVAGQAMTPCCGGHQRERAARLVAEAVEIGRRNSRSRAATVPRNSPSARAGCGRSAGARPRRAAKRRRRRDR